MKKRHYILAAIAGVTTGYLLGWYWTKKWYDINAPYGKLLGYPDCCIKAFCDQPPQLLKITRLTDDDRMRFDAAHINGEYTGFIPCAEHARQVKTGDITLQSLIKNRSDEFPEFPKNRFDVTIISN